MRMAFLLRDLYLLFYLEVARELEQKGFTIFWITNNRGWRRFIENQGISDERVIFIPTNIKEGMSDEGQEILQEIEERFSEFTVSKWILCDRALLGVPFELSKKMLGTFSSKLRAALLEKKIDAVIGELTFSIELIAYYLCRSLGIKFLYPDSVKIPSERFAFFESPAYGDEFMRNEPTAADLVVARDIYERWKTRKEKPHFWHVYLRKRVVDLKGPAKLARWLGETDYIAANVPLLIKRKSRELINLAYLKVAAPFSRIEDLNGHGRYALYPLHNQPEASVDVTAPEFSDQLATIRNIARSLPREFYLLVKEHPLAIGSRGRDFYRKLQEIPNVILLGPREDSYQALGVSDLVVAIASTLGYEAALLGKSVVVFSKIFYRHCPNVRYCSDPTQLSGEIKDALKAVNLNLDETLWFLGKVIANSYPGIRTNPKMDPQMMQKDNIDNWVHAFMDYARHGCRR